LSIHRFALASRFLFHWLIAKTALERLAQRPEKVNEEFPEDSAGAKRKQ